MQYTELHLHDHYSLLDGLNTPEEYFRRAAELGMTHLAQTNHGTLSGHRPFQKAAKDAGIIPILGLEAYYSGTGRFDVRPVSKREDDTQLYNHIGLLAMNDNGLRNLNKLSEIAWTEGFYMKGRVDKEVLEEYHEDIIMLSGCLNSPVVKAFLNDGYEAAYHIAKDFKRIFGERFFIEIQGHNPPEVNAALLVLSQNLDVKTVVTSDCHFAVKDDAWKEDAWLIISTNPARGKDIDLKHAATMHDMFERMNYLYPNRKMTFEKFGLWLHSAEEQMQSLAAQGIGTEPIENTQLIANMIGDYPFHENLSLLPSPEGDADELLWKMVNDGLAARGKDKDPTYLARRDEEMEVITGKGFSPYMIMVADAVSFAKSEGIMVGPARGSAAGCLVSYALGITGIDPIPANLLFFRFLDPSRDEFPDIDIDIEDTRRGEVQAYMLRKYGNVARIITFNTFKGKAAIKAAAKVFAVSYGEVNKALRGAEYPPDEDFFENWLPTPQGAEFASKYPETINLAKYLQDRIRGTGIHAGGLVVSNKPIADYAPIQTAQPEDKTAPRVAVVALDMNEAAEVGLIKIDFLGLNNLTIIQGTLNSINKRHGKDIDLYGIDFEDQAVYDDISSGFTKTLFQAEKGPYTGLIAKMGGVHTFEELVASNALVRPGASNSTIAGDYIKAKNSGEWSYIHPDVKYFTETTYGLAVYQEQQMLLCTELAGMTMVEANAVRKAIGKKKNDKLQEWKETFINGAAEKIGEAKAKKLWRDLEASAKYAFNRSHSYAYAMVTYWTAWLRHYYPLEYMTNVLKNADKADKVRYLMEAKRLGLTVMIPHVNVSDAEVSIQKDADEECVALGLVDVKGIKDKTASRIMARRPFANYADLDTKAKTKNSGISAAVLTSLNKIGAAAFEDNPLRGDERKYFYEVLSIPSFEVAELPAHVTAQFRPLEEYSDDEAFVCMGMVTKIKTGPGWSLIDMVDETGEASAFSDENTGIEVGQMYVMLIAGNSIVRYILPVDLNKGEGGIFRQYLAARQFLDTPPGMLKVIAFKSRTTKAGAKMGTVVLSDENKELVGAVVFPQMFQKAFIAFQPGAVVDVQLKETDKGGYALDYIL